MKHVARRCRAAAIWSSAEAEQLAGLSHPFFSQTLGPDLQDLLQKSRFAEVEAALNRYNLTPKEGSQNEDSPGRVQG
jgi:hypothetical protein